MKMWYEFKRLWKTARWYRQMKNAETVILIVMTPLTAASFLFLLNLPRFVWMGIKVIANLLGVGL